MRIMIKGGVWKNTEDEILKAAVMKYGKNQWARISSLLVRKSAKQCKARWYEWLDPSIKKTEWTREEDEKLLHLAKLLPTQWRTIAPIVGRTPSQCLERYEKLLDAACTKDENYEAADDPRKLRPGEIDPNPESKPARPDPVDMDEDEKEMLSEARARLANTRGKKAKRKAREKQLEEARRLASLQKRRELKAAGIGGRHKNRKRKGIDYNAEIPFEKRAPAGFYDTGDEDRPADQVKFPTTIEELEGKRRADVEAQLRRQDVARNKINERKDAPAAILQANKLNDPEAVRKRSKLMLPPPQISDHELEEIAKMGYASDLLTENEELTEGSAATRALLANYSQTPKQGITPVRTPQRTPAGKGDAIMMEAENLARLRDSQTPLLGGENPELHPSDFTGVTPRKKEIQTPNLMLTPSMTPSMTPGGAGLTPRIGLTPSRDGSSFAMTPRGTPFRDELHINEDMDMHDSAKLERQRREEARRSLRSGLTGLPQPRNEYHIVAQPPPEEIEEPEEKIEEDMSDKIAREKAEKEARHQALLRKRSKVLQRDLPRPPAASLELIRNSLLSANGDKSSVVPPTPEEVADELVRKELLQLLEHDNAKYPLDEKTEKKKGVKNRANSSGSQVTAIEDFEETELEEADKMVKEEAQFLCVAMGNENKTLDDFVKAHDDCVKDVMYFPTRNAYGPSSVAVKAEKVAALQVEMENARKKMEEDEKKAEHMKAKYRTYTKGHETDCTEHIRLASEVSKISFVVCLDGSVPGYHLYRGYGSGANNWIIQLQGGAWCDSIEDCQNRKRSRVGSSTLMETPIEFKGILSNKAAENPDFYNWNKAVVRYCDGASFSGDSENKTAQLQFRGKRIFLAVMEDLMAKGMCHAKQALLSGCSSGGLAAILRCDDFSSLFPPTTEVKCMSDAGFFLDAVDISGARSIRRMYSGVVNTQGLQNTLPLTCTSHLDPTSCFFPQNIINQVKTPLFVLNSAFDSWQIENSIAPPSADPSDSWHNCRSNFTCNASQMQFLEGFRMSMLDALKTFSMSNKNGLFIISRWAHCLAQRKDTWFPGNSQPGEDKGIAVVVGDWYFERAKE